jgi:uncharacterized SAM-binding protein YcdF (DUF218 family)
MLRALAEGLLFPPGGIIALGVLALILWRKKLARPARAASIIVLSLLWLSSTEAFAYLLAAPLEAAAEPLGEPEAASLPGGIEAVVVLGGGARGGAPDEGGLAAPMRSSVARLAYGLRLARASGLPLVISGGNPSGDAGIDSEAQAMARVARGLGFPEQGIVVEGSSATTEGNARGVGGLGYSRVALVTSASHMTRARRAFERVGVNIIEAPTDYLFLGRSFDLAWLLPSPEGLSGVWLALHEYLGLIFG